MHIHDSSMVVCAFEICCHVMYFTSHIKFDVILFQLTLTKYFRTNVILFIVKECKKLWKSLPVYCECCSWSLATTIHLMICSLLLLCQTSVNKKQITYYRMIFLTYYSAISYTCVHMYDISYLTTVCIEILVFQPYFPRLFWLCVWNALTVGTTRDT